LSKYRGKDYRSTLSFNGLNLPKKYCGIALRDSNALLRFISTAKNERVFFQALCLVILSLLSCRTPKQQRRYDKKRGKKRI